VSHTAGRRQALIESLPTDAFLVVELDRLAPPGMDAASLFYLSGFTGEGSLIVARADAALLTDARYLPRAAAEAGDLRLIEVENGYLEAMTDTIVRMGIQRLGFSARRMNHAITAALAAQLSARLTPLDDPVACLRRLKDRREVAAIRAAIALTEESLQAVLDGIEVGMSEREIGLELRLEMLRRGADDIAFEPIIAAGPNSTTGHHRSGERAIRRGELLLCDIGARVGQYNADLTRTFAVGEASRELREIYALALAANRAGIAALRAGVETRQAHDAIGRVFAGPALGPHGRIAGHGLGLEVHERPYLRRDPERLESGMVMTIEPGVYVPGVGGVRIEDVALVTDRGCELLTSFPKDELIGIG